jgi:hypothetical protein
MPNNRRFSVFAGSSISTTRTRHPRWRASAAYTYLRGVGWRALVELASQATSEAERHKFEARILAGERVTGAEIIRVRGR